MIPLIIRLVAVGSLFVSSALMAQNKEQKNQQTCLCLCPAYNASSQVVPEGCYDFYFTGGFTYWQPSQENMSLGIVGNISNPLNVIDGSVVNLDFDFHPGFQLGAGLGFPRDEWDVYLEYTWFRGTDRASKNLDPSNNLVTLYPTVVRPYVGLSSYFYGKEEWTLHMDFVDAELGRRYYVGKKLTFRPFIGLRAPFIRQHLDVEYLQNVDNPNNNLEVRMHFDSWGLGPRFGLCMDWDIGYSLRLYGKGGVDITYTDYTNFEFLQQNVTGSGQIFGNSRYNISDSVSYLRSHMDLALGLGWGSYFYNNRWYFDISADYCFQVFYGQNLLRSFVDDQSYVNISTHGDLFVQGLTIKLRFDY